jgi:WD40 repeat protein
LGHTGAVSAVSLSADGKLVASGNFDGTVRFWDAQSGACARVLRAARRYEHRDISGLTGTSNAQRHALLALGAVDRVRAAREAV